MEKNHPNRIKFMGIETKNPTRLVISQTQRNHPKAKKANKENINNINTQQEKLENNTENIKKDEESYIPYSCIPQLEKNDLSYYVGSIPK